MGARVYEEYQKLLKSANAVDFDDIIVLTVRLFEENPDVLEKYQNRFSYIMVDEYQDTNHAQYRSGEPAERRSTAISAWWVMTTRVSTSSAAPISRTS